MKKQPSRYEHFITMPDNRPYNPKIEKALLIIAAIVFSLCFAIILFSCNPTKRAYKAIEKLPPATTQDTGRLLKRSAATFPAKPPVIKEGKTVIIKGKDSTAFYKGKYNEAVKSKTVTKTEIKLKYKDTCTSANDTYEQGFQLGYEVGLYDGKAKVKPCDSVYRVDTITVIPHEYTVQLEDVKLQLRNAKDDSDKLKTECATKKTWILYLIVLCLLLAIGNILQFKFNKK